MHLGWWRGITAKLLWHSHGGQGLGLTMRDILDMSAEDILSFADWADRQREYEAREIKKGVEAARARGR